MWLNLDRNKPKRDLHTPLQTGFRRFSSSRRADQCFVVFLIAFLNTDVRLPHEQRPRNRGIRFLSFCGPSRRDSNDSTVCGDRLSWFSITWMCSTVSFKRRSRASKTVASSIENVDYFLWRIFSTASRGVDSGTEPRRDFVDSEFSFAQIQLWINDCRHTAILGKIWVRRCVKWKLALRNCWHLHFQIFTSKIFGPAHIVDAPTECCNGCKGDITG